jgi:hypothetical protein
MYACNVNIALLRKGTLFRCLNHKKFNKNNMKITVVLTTEVFKKLTITCNQNWLKANKQRICNKLSCVEKCICAL